MTFVLVATAIVASPALAGSGLSVPAGGERAQALHGYYLAAFTNEVGSGLPESSFCFRFKSSGVWSNTGSESFNGTYLLSGKQLFASAVWLPSPAIYMSLQGSVDAKQGSGVYVISGTNGYVSGGGIFTMTRKQSSGCT
jgi:hypothetical protein